MNSARVESDAVLIRAASSTIEAVLQAYAYSVSTPCFTPSSLFFASASNEELNSSARSQTVEVGHQADQQKLPRQELVAKDKLGAVNVGVDGIEPFVITQSLFSGSTSTGRTILCLPMRGCMKRFLRSSVQSRIAASSTASSRRGSSTSSGKHHLHQRQTGSAAFVRLVLGHATANPSPTRSCRPRGRLKELYFN